MKTMKILLIGSVARAEAIARTLPRAVLAEASRVAAVGRRGVADVVVFCEADATGETCDTTPFHDALVALQRSGTQVFVNPSSPATADKLAERLPPNIHVFDRPRTVHVTVHGQRLAIAGSPRQPGIRSQFSAWLRSTGWHESHAAIKLLCLHSLVEGMQYGEGTFVARWGDDVLCAHQLPKDAAAVFGGSVQRAQLLQHRLDGRRLASPVLYLGRGRTQRDTVDLAELTLAAGGRGGRALRLRLPALGSERLPHHHRAADGETAWPSYPRQQRTWSFLPPHTVTTVIDFPPPPLELPSFAVKRDEWRGPRH